MPGAQITERDAVISDNYNTLQALRRRCQELETHKFVLGYKVCVLRGKMAPARKTWGEGRAGNCGVQ